MPYGWHGEAALLQSHHWMAYSSFVSVLHRIRFMSFTVKASRDQIRNILENLAVNTPFSISTRFPDDAIYIDLDHSVPSRLITQIMLAIDLSDRQTEKGRPTADNISQREHSNFEDAKVAYYQAVGNLIDLVGPMKIETAHIFGVYTQGSFESEHGLIWTGTP